MGTIGRLVCRFPGPVISVPDRRVHDLNFRKALACCLEALEGEALVDAAGKGHGSHKDTIHPQFITEWLSGILRGIGSPLEVSRIYKRTMQAFLAKFDATKDKFAITIFLAALKQSTHGNTPLVHTLLTLATVPDLRRIKPPAYDIFDLSSDFDADRAQLKRILEGCKVPFQESPKRKLIRYAHEEDAEFLDRNEATHEAATKLQALSV